MDEQHTACELCSGVVDEDDRIQHASDCPIETNLWPLSEQDLDPRQRLVCYLCRAPFFPGECYTTIPSGPENVAQIPDAVTVVCIGCAVLHARPAM